MSNSSSTLARVDIFRDLEAEDLQRIESLSRRRRYETGQKLVEEGSGAAALFVIVSGRVRVTLKNPDGSERELTTVGAGGSFGEMALFQDWGRRSATVTAVEPTECLVLPRLDFLDELRRNPDIAIRLLAVLSQRVMQAQDVSHVAPSGAPTS